MGTVTELPQNVDVRMDLHEKLCGSFIDHTWSARTSDDTDALCATLHELGVTLCALANRIVGALEGIDVRGH